MIKFGLLHYLPGLQRKLHTACYILSPGRRTFWQLFSFPGTLRETLPSWNWFSDTSVGINRRSSRLFSVCCSLLITQSTFSPSNLKWIIFFCQNKQKCVTALGFTRLRNYEMKLSYWNNYNALFPDFQHKFILTSATKALSMKYAWKRPRFHELELYMYLVWDKCIHICINIYYREKSPTTWSFLFISSV